MVITGMKQRSTIAAPGGSRPGVHSTSQPYDNVLMLFAGLEERD